MINQFVLMIDATHKLELVNINKFNVKMETLALLIHAILLLDVLIQ